MVKEDQNMPMLCKIDRALSLIPAKSVNAIRGAS
jgi:hypothetical protein